MSATAHPCSIPFRPCLVALAVAALPVHRLAAMERVCPVPRQGMAGSGASLGPAEAAAQASEQTNSGGLQPVAPDTADPGQDGSSLNAARTRVVRGAAGGVGPGTPVRGRDPGPALSAPGHRGGRCPTGPAGDGPARHGGDPGGPSSCPTGAGMPSSSLIPAGPSWSCSRWGTWWDAGSPPRGGDPRPAWPRGRTGRSGSSRPTPWASATWTPGPGT